MKSERRGIVSGIVAGVSFGLIPLFSIPVLNEGMNEPSLLVYRYLFGSAGMLLMLMARRTDMRISLNEVGRISLLSLFYIGTAITTLLCYRYLSSGVATALVYTDPIWCALIGFVFLKERLRRNVSAALIVAIGGVLMLTGIFSQTLRFSLVGTVWGLLSGLSYALYLLFLPRLGLDKLPALKLTFYVFALGMVMMAFYCMVVCGHVDEVHSSDSWTNLILLGLIPTALSNICVTSSLRQISSTMVAILGALEPLTAMAVGILCLGDPFSLWYVGGTILVLASVYLLGQKGTE